MHNSAIVSLVLHQGTSGSDEVWMVEEETICSVFKGFEGDN